MRLCYKMHKKNHLLLQVAFVTALGFKPKTPSSVVRYSIQLSYAAIFESANI